jgi:hypothetical protein
VPRKNQNERRNNEDVILSIVTAPSANPRIILRPLPPTFAMRGYKGWKLKQHSSAHAFSRSTPKLSCWVGVPRIREW